MRDTNVESASSELDHVFRVMELFIANAKTYTQLSSGGLLLTVAFAHEVLGVAKDHPIPLDWSMIATWSCFLAATIAGATYQYLAVRFLEAKAKVPIHHAIDWPQVLKRNPWIFYALMMIAFYLGAALFTVTAIRGALRL
jgi:hypothetical protein